MFLSKLSKRSSLRNYIPKKIHSSIKTFLDLITENAMLEFSFIDGKMYASVKHNSSTRKVPWFFIR